MIPSALSQSLGGGGGGSGGGGSGGGGGGGVRAAERQQTEHHLHAAPLNGTRFRNNRGTASRHGGFPAKLEA
eukprot:3359321-Rhodomonas_salina.2